MHNLLSLMCSVGVVACVAHDASDETLDDTATDDQASIDEAILTPDVVPAVGRHLSCTLSGTSDRVASDFNYTTDGIGHILPASVKWNTSPSKTLDKISWAWFDNNSTAWVAFSPPVGGASTSHDDVAHSGTRNEPDWRAIESDTKIRMTVWGQGGKCISPP